MLSRMGDVRAWEWYPRARKNSQRGPSEHRARRKGRMEEGWWSKVEGRGCMAGGAGPDYCSSRHVCVCVFASGSCTRSAAKGGGVKSGGCLDRTAHVGGGTRGDCRGQRTEDRGQRAEGTEGFAHAVSALRCAALLPSVSHASGRRLPTAPTRVSVGLAQLWCQARPRSETVPTLQNYSSAVILSTTATQLGLPSTAHPLPRSPPTLQALNQLCSLVASPAYVFEHRPSPPARPRR